MIFTSIVSVCLYVHLALGQLTPLPAYGQVQNPQFFGNMRQPMVPSPQDLNAHYQPQIPDVQLAESMSTPTSEPVSPSLTDVNSSTGTKTNKKKAKTSTSDISSSTNTNFSTISRTSDNNNPSAATSAAPYTQQAPNKKGLVPGEVFGLVTLSDDPKIDKETVVIYQDGTLGIKEPSSPGYLFEALLLSEYGLLVAPEPLTTVKFNDKNVMFLNDSLFNPAPVFSADGWDLNTLGGMTSVCPSMNSVITYTPQDAAPACDDAVSVHLRIVPISGE